MDIWKFYDVTHREHVVCNPTSEEKLGRLVELLRLRGGDRVLDIASGKAEFLIRVVERYGVRAVGVDVSPYFMEDARRRCAERVPDAEVTLLQMDGAAFASDERERFDLSACIGASWIFGGHTGTLEALERLTAPGGWIIAGEPYWLREPPREYLEASGDQKESFGTHVENVEAGERLGLRLVHTLVSSKDDWDRYEGLQWYAAEEYARARPDDPDADEIAERVARERASYLRWGRDTLGWAIYAFRRPAGDEAARPSA
jgi:SAM-dependent methyltransferase